MNIEIIATLILTVITVGGIYMNMYLATQPEAAELLLKTNVMSRRWWAVILSFAISLAPLLWGWSVLAAALVVLTVVGYIGGYAVDRVARRALFTISPLR